MMPPALRFAGVQSIAAAACVLGIFVTRAAGGYGTRSVSAGPPLGASASTTQPKVLLDIVNGLGLLSTHEESTLRVSLTPGQWALSGRVQAYAALSSRVVRLGTDGVSGLAAPARETTGNVWRGLGLGPGVNWRLSDTLELFGEYRFQPGPDSGASAGRPSIRREPEITPRMKVGFSIRF